jgi:hypothetical protein
MAKAILEFSKMPKSCRECPLYWSEVGEIDKPPIVSDDEKEIYI